MKTNYLKPAELIIPLCLLAFVAPGLTFLNWALNETTRWLVLLALTFFLLQKRGRLLRGLFHQHLFFWVIIYASWCMMSTLWSEVPILSFAKAIVFFWISLVFLVAGYAWARYHSGRDRLNVLWLFSLVTLVATQGGVAEEMNTGASYYTGMTGNPNLLGFILFISSTWFIWQAFSAHREGRRKRFLLFVCLYLFDLYFLVLCHSRASLIAFAIILMGFLMGTGKFWRWLPYLVVTLFIGYLAYSYIPSVNSVLDEYASKANPEYLESIGLSGEDIWYSRELIWEVSYELAKQGGLVGGGYGVTIGEAFTAAIGPSVSSGQYGREQGNTQLAIMEQTGIIGLGLYLFLMLSIFLTWLGGMRKASQRSDKVALGLLGGALAGLLFQSILEAWWVAPGSPESATFWTLLGTMLAFTGPVKTESLLRMESPRLPENAGFRNASLEQA
jgi:hypothetical protein